MAMAAPEMELHRKDLLLVKMYCLIIVFVATLVPGMSPYYLRWNESFLVLGTQFAGGVFLAVSLIHFLSDADATFREQSSSPYPFAYMLACVGYLLTLLADTVVQCVYGRIAPDKHSASAGPETDGVAAAACTTIGTGLAAVPRASFEDALLLVLALCFHSVFEGMAIGIAPSEKDAWKALWTVSLHKAFAAIAMAIALLRILPNRPLLSCFAYAFAFAISSPVGVGVGIIINATTQGSTADWIYAISMSFASGIFIYVAINHLLAKGYIPASPWHSTANHPFTKFLAVSFGVAVVSVILIWD